MNTNETEENRLFEALLDYLRSSRGFDFTGYKRSSLQRRVCKRMQTKGMDNFGDYLDYLEVHPEEFICLLNTILINVTGFFRDTDAWEHLQSQTIPRILARKSVEEPVRVWSAGCASGEEAYTLAIVLAEILGVEQFRNRVKIYATDVDEEALSTARHASYSDKHIQNIPQELLERYFDKIGDRYVFRADLRRIVIFGRHDLVQDAPISRLDLLVCRNTLMYFNSETQSRILARFHFALSNTGALFLGKAEMLLTHSHLFSPLSLQNRIFARVAKISLRDRLLVLNQVSEEEASNSLANNIRLREAAFNAIPISQIIIDLSGNLVMANLQARSMFNLGLPDIGKPLQDLEISYRPLELRSLIDKVYSDQASLIVTDVSRSLANNSLQYLDIYLTPLQENGGDIIGVSIIFTDVTRYHILREEVQRSNQELETTNEELQSSNEELETTNEELQSTNEELETMNEELQSTNAELQAINDELRQRTFDLDQVNAFLKSILASLQSGVVVMDHNFQILSWNYKMEDLWGLRSQEVEKQSFFSLDIGLPVDQLREAIRTCVAGTQQQELQVDATNRRGQTINCQITCNPLLGSNNQPQGVILLMEAITP
ncbi:CheR family methyltransferase [Lyngbya aestuarii]|uniref:CheR family methyltransferase n=1 Tax=Lyngbya aestuarii TaxID=118322 RepID=UPI00403DBFEA